MAKKKTKISTPTTSNDEISEAKGPESDAREPYKAALWERVLATLSAVAILTLVFIVVLRKEPFTDQNQVVLVRIVLSLAVGVIGAVVPGFLRIDLDGGGVAIRAGGALALFVITFFFSPTVLPLAVSKEKLEKIERTSEDTRSDVGRMLTKFDSIFVQAVYELPIDEPQVKALATCLAEIRQAVQRDRKPLPQGLTLSFLGSNDEPSKPPIVSVDLDDILNEQFVKLSPKLHGLGTFLTFLQKPKLQIGINRSLRSTNELTNNLLGLSERPDLHLFVHDWPVAPQKGNFGLVILDESHDRVLVSWNGFRYPSNHWGTVRKVISIQDLNNSQFVAMLSNPGNIDSKLDEIAAKCKPIWINIRFDNNFVTFDNFDQSPPVLKWQSFSTNFPSTQTILNGKGVRPFDPSSTKGSNRGDKHGL